MRPQKKICVVTGTRAEYGLLYWTMKGLKESPYFKLQTVVTGMHLSPQFGNTYKLIERDGFKIDYKVKMTLSSDSESAVTRAIGQGTIGFAKAFKKLMPDLVLILGDRFELLSVACAATVFRIPIAHCHGGEKTEGLIDEAIRHALTKMSHLHFVSTRESYRRVLQLGEEPANIILSGAFGLENLRKLKLFTQAELESFIGRRIRGKLFLLTFHPVTLEKGASRKQFLELLNALDSFKDATLIFTKTNADTEGSQINLLIERYVKKNTHRAMVFSSMGQVAYLSALKHADVVIGNSSSGILEAPSLKTPCVNIGNRQAGRIRGKNVIDCEPRSERIVNSIKTALSRQFIIQTRRAKNPYEHGNSSQKVLSTLTKRDLPLLLKKSFHDLKLR